MTKLEDLPMAEYRLMSALLDIVPRGQGFHQSIGYLARTGRRLGFRRGFIIDLINMHPYTPLSAQREIERTVNYFYEVDDEPGAYSRLSTAVEGNTKALEAFISGMPTVTFDDIKAVSGVKVPDDEFEQLMLAMNTLFRKDEKVMIMHADSCTPYYIKNVKYLGDDSSLLYFPFFIVNPLSGFAGLSGDGERTFRGDSCVTSYRHVLVEMDMVPIEDQLKFWYKVLTVESPFNYKVKTITYSGKKSLHAILEVNIANRTQWLEKIRTTLFRNLLINYGVDMSCCSISRLSRLPGHFRIKEKQVQQLLYATKGDQLC